MIWVWLRRLFGRHKHRWVDWYVFDSSWEVLIPSGARRVVAQAVMMTCPDCGALQRRPIETWREARTLRKLLAVRRAEAWRVKMQNVLAIAETVVAAQTPAQAPGGLHND